MEPIGKLISFISRINQKEMAKRLKDHGFRGGGHQGYLKTILEHPGLNQDQLTNIVKFDKATTTRCIKQLEEAGYVQRVVDDHDRRSYLLYPTELAKSFEPTLYEILEQFNEDLTHCLTEEETQQLQGLLYKIYESKLGESE